MRIVNLLIGLSVGAYIAWKVVSPLPVPANPCLDSMECARPSPRPAPSVVPGPGLRIELYDPAMEPRRRYEDEAPHPAWISSAEIDALAAPGTDAPARRQGLGFTVTGLQTPGGQGLCLVPDHGPRRCVAFTAHHRE